MQKQTSIVLMNFSGIYREEEFWKNRQVSWIEVQDICGTNCYCDDEAIAEVIAERVVNLIQKKEVPAEPKEPANSTGWSAFFE